MKQVVLLAVIAMVCLPACSQTSEKSNSTAKSNVQVGGNCEGCEAVYESPVPFEKLTPTATLPDFNEPGPKIKISGIVYQKDGKTPASDVVIFVYHTDQNGHYTPGPNAKGFEKRNGRVRGWLKTGKDGRYQFYTLKPAPYPGTNIPAHIHIILKEPDKNEYYIDEYLFEGDPFLTPSERKRQDNRGGSGIIKLLPQKNGITTGVRNIMLGVNIPGYQ